MKEPYREHPHEDALERFLLNQCEDEELEIVETHILACETCVTRLETLDLNQRALKMALQNQQAAQARKLAQQTTRPGWLNWLTIPRLSFAGAALAACTFLVTVSVPRQVNLEAFRGNEVTTVQQWVPLHLHLNAADLPSGPVGLEVVDSRGDKVWEGKARVANKEVSVTIPRLKAAGDYLVRINSETEKDGQSQTLREFSIKAKPLF